MLSLLNRWKKDKKGVAAVEFAIVAVPFFMVIIGILETCLFFAAGSALEGAAHDAARVLRTGQAQKSGDPLAMFEDRMCGTVGIIVNCEDITYEVVEIPADGFYGVSDFDPTFDADGNLESQGFEAGGVESTMLVRLFYRYEFMTPFVGHMMGDEIGNSYGHMSTVVLRNEPYAFE